jgi:hypothetical protein
VPGGETAASAHLTTVNLEAIPRWEMAARACFINARLEAGQYTTVIRSNTVPFSIPLSRRLVCYRDSDAAPKSFPIRRPPSRSSALVSSTSILYHLNQYEPLPKKTTTVSS